MARWSSPLRRHSDPVCLGITPYDATHIGHAATYLAWDLLIRAWLDAGKQVRYVQNVTDVDDPLLERASRDGEDWRELASREIALFRSDMTALRVLPPDHYIGAVEALPLIEDFNRTLRDRGALYEVEGDTYFSRGADPAFGSVSGLDGDAMFALCAENGGDPTRPGKKDPVDPLVWMAARPGEPSWPSEFGPGGRVACGVRGDRDPLPRDNLRRPGGRTGSDLPASRDERRPRAGRPGQPRRHRGAVRAPVRALRNGAAGRREDVEVARQPGIRFPAAG